MPDVKKVKVHFNDLLEYAGLTKEWIFARTEIIEDALNLLNSYEETIDRQQAHIAKLHRGIIALRDAMKGEARDG